MKRLQKKDKNTPYYIGGQAVMEGVMMRGKTMYAMAVRKPDGEITLIEKNLSPVTKKYPILQWPVIRGVVAFVDSMTLGLKTLTQSADIAVGDLDDEDEKLSRFEQFLKDKLGDKLNDFIIQCSVVLAIIAAISLFILLPTWIGSLFTPLLQGQFSYIGIIEGLIRIAIFITYVYLVSFSKDIKRVYQYHGAEHKTINCYEAGETLIPANIQKFSRLHKRCGTSFLLIVMLISMIVFLFVRTDALWLRLLSRIILIPVIAGLSYEVIKWAGRNDGLLVKAVSFPGFCLQRITTVEPDDAQIETAVSALQAVLAHENTATSARTTA